MTVVDGRTGATYVLQGFGNVAINRLREREVVWKRELLCNEEKIMSGEKTGNLRDFLCSCESMN